MGKIEDIQNEQINNPQELDYWQKKFKDYSYVCISTLNQMVNYIPIKLFEFKDIFYLTIDKDKGRFKNKDWDKNLIDLIKDKNHKLIKLEMNDKEFFNLTDVKDFLNNQLSEGKLKDKKIIWNITGGQRHFIIAIEEIIQELNRDDVILYLEGNNNNLFIRRNEETNSISYKIEDLNIETALKLMGFEPNKIESESGNDKNINMQKFWEDYKNIKELREILIKGLKEKFDRQTMINEIENIKLKNKEAVIEVVNWGYDKHKSSAFGYILEELAFYLIKKSVDKNKVAELKHSVRIYDENNKQFAEIDIMLVTKNGKVITFECKSGGMSSDTAKARNLVTYAISGVYGLPILITPLLENEKNDLSGLDNELYKNIKTSINLGEKAGLEVWGLDEIGENLKKYLKS